MRRCSLGSRYAVRSMSRWVDRAVSPRPEAGGTRRGKVPQADCADMNLWFGVDRARTAPPETHRPASGMPGFSCAPVRTAGRPGKYGWNGLRGQEKKWSAYGRFWHPGSADLRGTVRPNGPGPCRTITAIRVPRTDCRGTRRLPLAHRRWCSGTAMRGVEQPPTAPVPPPPPGSAHA